MIVMVTAVESRPWRARFFLHDDLLHVMLRSLTIHLMRPLVQACGLYLLLKAIPKAGPEREAVLKRYVAFHNGCATPSGLNTAGRYRHHELVEHLLGVSVVYAQSRDLPLPSRTYRCIPVTTPRNAVDPPSLLVQVVILFLTKSCRALGLCLVESMMKPPAMPRWRKHSRRPRATISLSVHRG